MERICTSVSDFETIRKSGGLYVDKTDIIHRLVGESADFQFFLARPRRFGKSLLVSTIRCLFEGRRDLFEGLAIAAPEVGWDWEAERCPVIHLDMSQCTGTIEQVESKIASCLAKVAECLSVPLRDVPELDDRFSWLVQDVAATSPTGKCVVLVDEYDKPLVEHIGTPEVRAYQDFLRRFYTVIKATGHLQRFCLMTGVSKFSKVSVFSSLNNLVDLTMDRRVSTLLGYTHEEVRWFFPEALRALADALGTDVDGAFDRLVSWYDGYCFDKSMVPVFNPVSLGRCLSTGDIGSYWFETGTPGWLMSYAKKVPVDVDDIVLGEEMLGTYEPESPLMTALLFQTGYLTIKGVDRGGRVTRYRLGLPNMEVADGFSTWLADAYSDAGSLRISAWQESCRQAVEEGDVPAFVEALQSFFASIGYDLTDRLSEQAYQCVVVAILRFVGIMTDAEVRTSRGRVDMVCRAPGQVLVVELKVASGEAAGQAAAADAIAQIRERGYAEPFAADAACGRLHVQLLGMAFDCDIHNIAAWECRELQAKGGCHGNVLQSRK